MKFKALRTKREPKEFVELHFHKSHSDSDVECCDIYTSELPNPQPLTATIEGMKQYYDEHHPLPIGIDLNDYELIEFEAYEVNTVGADIRNKLTPSLNLISLIRIERKAIVDEIDEEKLKAIRRFIDQEMEKCEENIKYISNLL